MQSGLSEPTVMPRYFFDTDDGERVYRDDVGMDFERLDDVKDSLRHLLSDLIQMGDVTEGARDLKAVVRNADGTVLYRGSVVLRIERADGV